MRNNVSRGFSLIELMIVIAIIGILAAVAVPSYRIYVIKARIAEVFAFFALNKIVIEEYIILNNKVPPFESPLVPMTHYTANTSKWVSTWKYEGKFGLTALLNSSALGIPSTPPQKIYLRPHYEAGSDTIKWTCSTFDASTWKYVPPSCQVGDPVQSEWDAG